MHGREVSGFLGVGYLNNSVDSRNGVMLRCLASGSLVVRCVVTQSVRVQQGSKVPMNGD